MKKTALILGIVGGLIAGGLGMKWIGDFGALTEQQRMMAEAMGEGDRMLNTTIAAVLLLGSLVAGIVGGIFAARDNLLAGSVLMLAGGVIPLLFAKQAVIFTAVLIAGGVVAFVAYRKETQAAVRERT
jgi:hypothetical protein